MSGNNMESLLLGGDDSSSGESDSEAAAAAPRTSQSTPTAQSSISANNQYSNAPPTAGMSQSEMSQRLKSLYSSPGNSNTSHPPVSAPQPQSYPQQPQPYASGPAAHSSQQQQQQQQQPQQQASSAPLMRQHFQPSTQPPTVQHVGAGGGGGGVRHATHPNVMMQSRAPPSSSQISHHPQSRHSLTSSTSNSARAHDPFEPTPVSHILQRQQEKAHQRQQHQHQQLQQPQSQQQQQQQTRPTMPSGGGGPTNSQSGRSAYSQHPLAPSQQQQRQQALSSSQGHHRATSSMQTAITSNSSNNGVRTSHSSNTMPNTNHPSGLTSPSGGSSSRTSSMPTNPQDRAAMERELKKQKEKFLVFTRVLLKYLEQKDPPVHAKVKAIIKDCAERNKRQEPGYESVTKLMRARLKQVVDEAYWKRAENYLHHFMVQKAKTAQAGSSSAAVVLADDKTSGVSLPGPSTNGSSATTSVEAAERKKAELQRLRQLQLAHQKQAVASRSATSTGQTAASVRQEVSKQSAPRQQAAQPSTAAAPSASPATPSSTPPTAASTKGKSGQSTKKSPNASKSRKSSTSPTPRRTSNASGSGAASAAPTASEAKKDPVVPPPVREYKEFMEMVDHAIHLGDWSTTALMLGSKTSSQLSEEQRNLLYSDPSPIGAIVPPESMLLRPEWGRTNIISSRVAWARLRLREQNIDTNSTLPVVGDNPLTSISYNGDGSKVTLISRQKATAWFNEDTAEKDSTLAVLSEGCEIYLKSVLEKALHCARQRQNLDGIRLWHQQSTPGAPQPPLTIRLGCDVSRQVARAAGNAAMTCKRMEEALERQSDLSSAQRTLSNATLSGATSMAELSLKPKLARGAEDANYEAKRSFEIYGGKESSQPPLGRVPKKAKLEVADFLAGMHLVNPGKHRARTVSSSFAF